MPEELLQIIQNEFPNYTVTFDPDYRGHARVIVATESGRHVIQFGSNNPNVGQPIVDRVSQIIREYYSN